MALLLRLATTSTVDAVLGDIHRVAQRRPHVARRIARSERVRGGNSELVENDIAHKGATEMLAKLGGHREGEFGMLHSFSVSGVLLDVGRTIVIQTEFTLRLRCSPHAGDRHDDPRDHKKRSEEHREADPRPADLAFAVARKNARNREHHHGNGDSYERNDTTRPH